MLYSELSYDSLVEPPSAWSGCKTETIESDVKSSFQQFKLPEPGDVQGQCPKT